MEGLRKALSLLYAPSVVYLGIDLDNEQFNKQAFDTAIEWIYRQEHYSSEMLEAEPVLSLIQETNNMLSEAYQLGIANSVIPKAMDAKMRESVFLFSACKTHQELSEASQMLRSENGSVKSFSRFATDVTKVYADYNINYLRAEYSFAVSSSQMAARWAEVERDGDSYNLQYRTADDPNVRETHRALHNITLPPSDPFWDQYFPPNGWGCRCNAVQVRKTKYETSDPQKAADDGLKATTQISVGVDTGVIFRFNPGKGRQIFPPKHPYYKISQETKEVIARIIKPITNRKELEAELTNLASRTDWFERGFIQLGTSTQKGSNGYTDLNGNIFLSSARMKNCINGVGKLKRGDKISFNEADSIATLWHEITHNRSKTGNSYLTKEQTNNMELANEFVSRNTLPEFYRAYGQKMEHQKLMNDRESTGYNKWVKAYTQVVELTKSDINTVVNDVKTHLFNQHYTNQEAGLIDAIMKNQAIKKADGNPLNETDVKRLVKWCFIGLGDSMTKRFNDIIRCKD